MVVAMRVYRTCAGANDVRHHEDGGGCDRAEVTHARLVRLARVAASQRPG